MRKSPRKSKSPKRRPPLLKMNMYVGAADVVAESKKGNLKAVKDLVDRGAHQLTINNGLQWASRNGHLEVVKYLVDKGGDVQTDNNYGLRWASYYGHLEVVRYLVDNGGDVTADNNFAIRNAAPEGHIKVVKYLVEKGADSNVGLQNATQSGNLEVVKYLIDSGADIHSNDDKALLNAARGSTGNFPMVKYLYSRGANIQRHGLTILNMALNRGDVSMVKWLVDVAGINPHFDDDILVRTASDRNLFDIVKYLVIYHNAPTTHVKQVFIDRLATLGGNAVKQWRNRMEVDEANLKSPFGKYMAEKNYAKHLDILKEDGIISEEYSQYLKLKYLNLLNGGGANYNDVMASIGRASSCTCM
jgi:ankyrin repeat protein